MTSCFYSRFYPLRHVVYWKQSAHNNIYICTCQCMVSECTQPDSHAGMCNFVIQNYFVSVYFVKFEFVAFCLSVTFFASFLCCFQIFHFESPRLWKTCNKKKPTPAAATAASLMHFIYNLLMIWDLKPSQMTQKVLFLYNIIVCAVSYFVKVSMHFLSFESN